MASLRVIYPSLLYLFVPAVVPATRLEFEAAVGKNEVGPRGIARP